MGDPSAKSELKPRVLLSILQCSNFEEKPEELFTAICAGFGRFECERLLKPSGVELLNLPPSSHIEVTILRRLPGGHREQLWQAVLPISLVMLSASGATLRESQVWEGWLGLVPAGALNNTSAEWNFQTGCDLANASSKTPKLLFRLQYLPAGVSATAARGQMMNVAGLCAKETAVERRTSQQKPMGYNTPPMGGVAGGLKQGHEPMWSSMPPMRVPGKQPRANSDDHSPSLRTSMMQQQQQPPHKEYQRPAHAAAGDAGAEVRSGSKDRYQRPPSFSASLPLDGGRPTSTMPGGVSISVPAAEARRSPSPSATHGALPVRLLAGPPTAGRTVTPVNTGRRDGSPKMQTPFANSVPLGDRLRQISPFANTLPLGREMQQAGRSPKSSTPTALATLNLHQTHSGDFRHQQQEISFSGAAQQFDVPAQESAATELLPALSGANDARTTEAPTIQNASQKIGEHSAMSTWIGEAEEFRFRNTLLEKENAELKAQLAALQKAAPLPPPPPPRLRDEPPPPPPEEETPDFDAPRSKRVERNGSEDGPEELPTSPHWSLAEVTLERALDAGSEASFESWLATAEGAEVTKGIDAAYSNFLTCCRRAAAASSTSTKKTAEVGLQSESSAWLIYKPDKRDPLDCLWAAGLLRLGVPGQPLIANLGRIGPGLYNVAGRRVSCRMDDRGRMLVRRRHPGAAAHQRSARDTACIGFGYGPGATDLVSALVPMTGTVAPDEERQQHVDEKAEDADATGGGEELELDAFLKECVSF